MKSRLSAFFVEGLFYWGGYFRLAKLFYNVERLHQPLGQRRPDVIYGSEMVGSAMIFEKYPRAVEEPKMVATANAIPGQCHPPVFEVKCVD